MRNAVGAFGGDDRSPARRRHRAPPPHSLPSPILLSSILLPSPSRSLLPFPKSRVALGDPPHPTPKPPASTRLRKQRRPRLTPSCPSLPPFPSSLALPLPSSYLLSS
ncbi:unnamed protein product [Closterium sp. NIES-53]